MRIGAVGGVVEGPLSSRLSSELSSFGNWGGHGRTTATTSRSPHGIGRSDRPALPADARAHNFPRRYLPMRGDAGKRPVSEQRQTHFRRSRPRYARLPGRCVSGGLWQRGIGWNASVCEAGRFESGRGHTFVCRSKAVYGAETEGRSLPGPYRLQFAALKSHPRKFAVGCDCVSPDVGQRHHLAGSRAGRLA